MRLKFTLALLLAAASAQAREQYGVRMPDSVTVQGRQLKLNGMGLRKKKMIFSVNVYVAGLYAEAPSKNALELVSSDQGKRMTLYMLRDLDKGKITDALREGFEKNSKAQLPVLKGRLDRLSAMIPDAKKGSTIVITYVPGTGTVLAGAGEREVIEGKDFADALFSVWLGRNAADDELKAGLLGVASE
jgi:hypothetical protein